MNDTPSTLSSDIAEPISEEAYRMPRISKTTLGLIGLAVGVGAALFFFRHDLPDPRRSSVRRRLERTAHDVASRGARVARRFELPHPDWAHFESDGRLGRLLNRWRD